MCLKTQKIWSNFHALPLCFNATKISFNLEEYFIRDNNVSVQLFALPLDPSFMTLVRQKIFCGKSDRTSNDNAIFDIDFKTRFSTSYLVFFLWQFAKWFSEITSRTKKFFLMTSKVYFYFYCFLIKEKNIHDKILCSCQHWNDSNEEFITLGTFIRLLITKWFAFLWQEIKTWLHAYKHYLSIFVLWIRPF